MLKSIFIFQLGHFFAEMDREENGRFRKSIIRSFNWATSSQKWIGVIANWR